MFWTTCVETILGVRFVKNYAKYKYAKLKKNDIVRLRWVKNHDASDLRLPFHDRRDERRPYVTLLSCIYACLKKYG